MIDQFSLSGKVFVVSGASSGLGRAMLGFLASAGAQVVGVARRQKPLEQATQQIEQQGGSACYVVADLGQRESIPDIAIECAAKYGSVHGVINAAGVNLRQPENEVDLDSWDKTINLNLSAPFFFSREFVPGMKKAQYGRIINISSLQSERAFPNGLPYGASKGGINQLTRAMAETWSRSGITCNAIAPGFFPTELTTPVFDNPETESWAAQQTCIGRNGTLDDLFGATIFFASPASGYVTGQTLYVDGGFTAR